MPRIIIILILLSILVYLGSRFRKQSRDKQKKIARNSLLTVVILLLFALTITGRLNWLLALIGALIPMLPKLFSWGMRLLPAFGALLKGMRVLRPRQDAQMVTRYLRLVINQSTGEMQGQVLDGPLKGASLAELNQQNLQDLLALCQQQDRESAALLIAYLDRHHQGWQNTESSRQQSSQQSGFKPGAMDVKEARDILGVKENAKQEDIIKAHRQLMQKLHPDRGGSDYLATKINQAKDILLNKTTK